MTVLLTGVTGFVGSALLRKLRAMDFERGNKVFCLSSRKIPGWKCINHRGWKFSKEDISSVGLDDIDVIVHCGATAPHTPEDFLPAHAGKFAANVRNTCWLCENLPHEPRKMVFISTTDVYGNVAGPVSETMPTSPASMYGASKLICEGYLRDMARSQGFKLDVLRLGPIYGEGEETYSKIVSSFVRRIAEGKEVCLRGTGEETRSLLHVDDCCTCIVRSMCETNELPTVNIASGRSVSVRDIVKMIANEFGVSPCIVGPGGPRGRSDSFDNSLARSLFGDYERPLSDGVHAYVNYFKSRWCNEGV